MSPVVDVSDNVDDTDDLLHDGPDSAGRKPRTSLQAHMNTSSLPMVGWYAADMGHGVQGRDTPPARLDAASAGAVAATLQALTAPSRLLILSQLRQAPATVTALTTAIGMEQSAISHQLRLLRTMGLVTTVRNGRNIVYSLYDSHVASLLDEAVYHAEHLRLGAPERGTHAG